MHTSTIRTPVFARRLVILGTPLIMGMVSVLHPQAAGSGIVAALQPRLGLWLGIHLLQLILLGLLGATLWLLISGRTGAAATVSRLAIGFFVAFYSAFD